MGKGETMTDRGTRLENSDFYNGGEINEHARSFAIMCKVDVDREWAKFCDYWRAKTGASATKKDWLATWRNWCRKAEQDGERRPWRANGTNSESDRLVAASSSQRFQKWPITAAFDAIESLRKGQPLDSREREALKQWDGPVLRGRAARLGLTLP